MEPLDGSRVRFSGIAIANKILTEVT